MKSTAIFIQNHLNLGSFNSWHNRLTFPNQLSAWDLYKKFLTLCVLYPHLTLVPNVEIDLIWHQHILDTQNYSAFCQREFGQFIHHVPKPRIDAGQPNPNDIRMTQDLFQKHFGIDLFTSKAGAQPSRCEDLLNA